MTETRINIIAAISEVDGGLGKNNELLWRISEDLKRFKKLTSGHPVIMGRKTFESIGKALPDRTNIVVTRNADYKTNGCLIASSLSDAIKLAQNDSEIFIIGGGEIYKEAIGLADRLYLTVVQAKKPADVFFPPYDEFKKVVEKEEQTDEKTGLKFTWLTLEKPAGGSTT